MDQVDKAELFRKRFFGRQDVYGRRTQHGYAPVCKNFWQPRCHIRLKDGITCAQCEPGLKDYTPVSNESVLKHIVGDEAQIQYVLLEDGMIHFGAIDFDNKPGKEKISYKWEEVLCVHKLLDEWEIPHGIARSTTNGFHIYFFFEEGYPANRFRSVILDIYEQVGFLEQSRMGIKPIPEIFPKQSGGGVGGIGNGIKCPMIEPQFKVGRNCWVTDNNEVVPAEFQWDYFSKIGLIPVKFFDSIIEDKKIQIIEDTVTSSRNYSSIGGFTTRKKWQPPMIGSIEKVLEGCAAFRRVRGKIDKSEELSHHEGFALYHMCMNTSDGMKWWEDNSKKSNWGVTAKDQQQLEHSLGKNYAPWTCLKLQENGICHMGTKCFDKKPPLDNVEGKVVVRDDVPESEWPEPSPIRYAYGTGEDFLAKLQEEVLELKTETSIEEVINRLKGISLKAQVFDSGQQTALREYIVASGLMKLRELNKLFKDAGKNKHEELKKSASQRDDVAIEGGIFYQKTLPYGYSIIRKGRDGEQETQILCDTFDINILEDRVILIEDQENQRTYRGVVKYAGAEREFEIETDRWDDNTEMSKYFSRILGTRFNVLKQNIGLLKHAIIAFTRKSNPIDSTYHTVQGWYKKSFVMPSTLIDKDGVRENTQYLLDLSGKHFASNLDFSVMPEDKLKEVLFHIKTDLLQAWDHEIVYTVMSHVFLPPLLRLLKIEYKPALWVEGKTGTGKTALNDLVSNFYGEMKNNPSWSSTWRSLEGYGHWFKDCLLVIDDYKDLTQAQAVGAKMLLQYAYDNNPRTTLTRTGDQRKARDIRCLILTSGEDSPNKEASVISRMLIVEAKKRDQMKTHDKLQKCMDMKEHYRGVTPHFIHWMLNQDIQKLKTRINEYKSNLQSEIIGETNADRICQNIAYNYTAWNCFIGFLRDREIVDPLEAQNMIDEHWENMKELRTVMSMRCRDEQNGEAFVSVLQEILESGKASIKNLEGYEHDHSTTIGWVDEEDSSIGHFLINTTHDLVLAQTRSEPIKGSIRAIGAQLFEMGLMVAKDKSRYQKTVKGYSGRVWVLSLAKLGLIKDNVTPIRKEPEIKNVKTDGDNLW